MSLLLCTDRIRIRLRIVVSIYKIVFRRGYRPRSCVTNLDPQPVQPYRADTDSPMWSPGRLVPPVPPSHQPHRAIRLLGESFCRPVRFALSRLAPLCLGRSHGIGS